MGLLLCIRMSCKIKKGPGYNLVLQIYMCVGNYLERRPRLGKISVASV